MIELRSLFTCVFIEIVKGNKITYNQTDVYYVTAYYWK